MKPQRPCADAAMRADLQTRSPLGLGVCAADEKADFLQDSYSESGAIRPPRTQEPGLLHTGPTLGFNVSADQFRDDDSIDVLPLVEAVFPGSRLTRRRTRDEHAALWLRLTRRAEARRDSETLATTRLEHLRRRHDGNTP